MRLALIIGGVVVALAVIAFFVFGTPKKTDDNTQNGGGGAAGAGADSAANTQTIVKHDTAGSTDANFAGALGITDSSDTDVPKKVHPGLCKAKCDAEHLLNKKKRIACRNACPTNA